MLPAMAMALDVIEARPGVTAEMAAFVAVPDPVATGIIPEEAVIAPIAVIEGAVIAIVIAVVLGRTAGPATDIHPLTGGAARHQDKYRQGNENFPHTRPFPGSIANRA